jgi:hypothetical protein
MSKINQYIDFINEELNNGIDVAMLETEDVIDKLKLKLVELFKKVYETDSISWSDCDEDDGFALVPALIETYEKKQYIALIDVSVQDSGEHYDTIFFTHKGLIHQEELKENGILDVVPYRYKPLIEILGDIHSEQYLVYSLYENK